MLLTHFIRCFGKFQYIQNQFETLMKYFPPSDCKERIATIIFPLFQIRSERLEFSKSLLLWNYLIWNCEWTSKNKRQELCICHARMLIDTSKWSTDCQAYCNYKDISEKDLPLNMRIFIIHYIHLNQKFSLQPNNI